MTSVDTSATTPSSAPPIVCEPEIRVKVAASKLEAYMTLYLPDNCRQPTLPDLQHHLEDQGICFGVDENALKQVLRRPGVEFPCARGVLPQNGENAVVQYSFSLDNRGRPVEKEDGRVDFKNLNLFTLVHNNDVLAKKIPATPGIPGINVYGDPIAPLPGKDVLLPAGKNVRLDTAGLELIATTDGQVIVERGKIHVQPVLTINGDVDFSTGNIDFTGNVVILGSVNAGFTVHATGTVDIHGLISGGSVSAGQIIVRHGIQGMNKGVIRSDADVVAHFVENADIRAGRDVIVNSTILHSRVEAYRRVLLKAPHSQIIGGKILAGEEIITHSAGRPRAATTELRVGSIPSLEEEHRRLSWRQLEARHELEQLSKPLALYEHIDCRSASSEQLQEKIRLQNQHRELALEIAAHRCRIAEINTLLQPTSFSRICIAGSIYAGVFIAVGELSQTLDDPLHSVMFVAEEGKLQRLPYRPEGISP